MKDEFVTKFVRVFVCACLLLIVGKTIILDFNNCTETAKCSTTMCIFCGSVDLLRTYRNNFKFNTPPNTR